MTGSPAAAARSSWGVEPARLQRRLRAAMEVESDLADGDHRRRLRQVLELRDGLGQGAVLRAPQRMDAHGHAQPGVALGQLQRGAGAGDAGRRDHRPGDAGRGRALHDRVAIGGKARVVQMAVGVDQRRRQPSAPLRARRTTGSGTGGVPPRRVATNAA